MNKNRVEALSDGVFAIVLTLLIFEVRIPENTKALTDAEVWQLLVHLLPLISSFALTFLVVSVFWINHNFVFHTFMKQIDRYLNLMNFVYLLFLVFVPFSASLWGMYPYNIPAALIYGLNILAVIIMSASMVRYLSRHKDLRNEDISKRLVKQARVRTALTEISYVLGIISSFVFIPLSVFFYLFPLIFNLTPGSLNFMEKLFKFELS